MTETAYQITSNMVDNRKPGTIGIAHGCVDIQIVDDELCVRGTNVFEGYLGNHPQDGWLKDGWFRTGDTGVFDKDAFLILTGRIKELINRGGEKISPVHILIKLCSIVLV